MRVQGDLGGGLVSLYRKDVEALDKQIAELTEIKGDFCKCFDLAQRMDSHNPTRPRSFTGSVSERLTRSVEDLEREVRAWQERDPQMEFRRQDNCIGLKFSEFQKEKG